MWTERTIQVMLASIVVTTFRVGWLEPSYDARPCVLSTPGAQVRPTPERFGIVVSQRTVREMAAHDAREGVTWRLESDSTGASGCPGISTASLAGTPPGSATRAPGPTPASTAIPCTSAPSGR